MATDVVLFALEREARPFRKLRADVPVRLTGVGVERARAITLEVLKAKPACVILAGFGGALTASAKVGDVIVARDVIDESGRIWPCTGRGTGRVLTVNRMIRTGEEKLSLGERFQASVCDMESAAVAELCAQAGTPFVALRAISDTADRTLHPALDRLIVNGQVSPLRAALMVLRHPRLMIDFYRLGRDTNRASCALAETLSQNIINHETRP